MHCPDVLQTFLMITIAMTTMTVFRNIHRTPFTQYHGYTFSQNRSLHTLNNWTSSQPVEDGHRTTAVVEPCMNHLVDGVTIIAFPTVVQSVIAVNDSIHVNIDFLVLARCLIEVLHAQRLARRVR